MRSLHLITFLAYLASFANASSRWEQTSSGWGLVKHLILRGSHDDGSKLIHQTGLSLISGGMPRTGTKSITTALKRLGFNVYDNLAMMKHGHYEKWIYAAVQYTEDENLEPIRRMVDEIESLGYTATMDVPMNFFAPALIQVRPDAKLLWNYRAKGIQDWYRSLVFINWFIDPLFYARPWKWFIPNHSEQMRPLIHLFTMVEQPIAQYERVLPWYERMISERHPMEADKQTEQRWEIAYHLHPMRMQHALVEVRGEEALETQYLEFTTSDGWKPLLDFIFGDDDLGVHAEAISALSKEPFPHVNDKSTLLAMRKVLDFIGMIFPLFVMCLLYLVWIFARLAKKVFEAVAESRKRLKVKKAQ